MYLARESTGNHFDTTTFSRVRQIFPLVNNEIFSNEYKNLSTRG